MGLNPNDKKAIRMWTQYRGVARERARANLNLLQRRRAVNLGIGKPASIDRNTTIREVVRECPSALAVVIELGIPVTCADRTIAETARITGQNADHLIATLQGAQKAAHAAERAETRMHPMLEPSASAPRADQSWSRPRKQV
jgi:hypothetical protein